MKKLFSAILVLIIFLVFNACSKKDGPSAPPPDPPNPPASDLKYPKKEMRGVWMATVWGLDWPMGDYNAASQKQQYINYLDKFKQLNLNAVFVQVKGMGDAFYNSPYEPWSGNITGTRGQDPGYDVMKFMIDEAHARGLEFHAWINPFRIATRTGTSTPYPALHASIDPSWVVSHEKWQMYNPAIPEARQRLADIVKDIITKYNVDGIHMDDYFYPDPSSAGTMVSDQPDYEKYGAGYATIQEFRLANVDKAIKGVFDVIVASKPEVIFSISPTSSFDYNKNTLYADIVKWATQGWMDVVIPQIYQHASFETRLNEWDRFNNKPFLMIGHSIYQDISSASTLSSELALVKKKKAVAGSLFYSAKYLNIKPEIATKMAELYKYPSVIPFLGRAVAPAPAEATNVRFEGSTLKWATTGTVRSVVYYFADLTKEGIVLAITDKNELVVSGMGYYSVSTINVDNAESTPSKTVKK